MENNLLLIVSIGLAVGFFVNLFIYARMFKNKKQKPNFQSDTRVEKDLKILSGDCASAEKAKAFIDLMYCDYVLLHTLSNHGNDYDDDKQAKGFQNSLSSQVITKLYSLEGRNG